MTFFKPTKWIDVLWHLLAILGVISILLIIVFKIVLPSYTHHGDEIKVPNVENLSLEEAVEILEENHLRCEIMDTVYSANHDANCVVTQTPKANSQVKTNRKIYLTINKSDRPTWTFRANFINKIRKRSFSEVKYRLDSLNISYTIDTIYVENVKDYVHEVFYKGDTLKSGTRIELGRKNAITLQVSTGERKPDSDSTEADN